MSSRRNEPEQAEKKSGEENTSDVKRSGFDSVRENIEAIVVAVILAVFVRHFAVEAFESAGEAVVRPGPGGDHDVVRGNPGRLPVGIDDVDAAASKVESLGGSIMVPPADIPYIGRFAGLKDPQGSVFFIFKPAV